MWGTRALSPAAQLIARFIPTHVGNTGWHIETRANRTVHPHACGEHAPREEHQTMERGSSPRMWGTRVRRNPGRGQARFIPTHVGNTLPGRAGVSFATVHPHACGEHLPAAKEPTRVTGSSPRMWGTRHLSVTRPCGSRFIPTHVGNTAVRRPDLCPHPVHPHACGEHEAGLLWQIPQSGSSPRMWGTLSTHTRTSLHRRFIPTHVGNTSKISLRLFVKTVHPHACGEHCAGYIGEQACRGSSPRMWGTPCSHDIFMCEARFIPTHVGNTSGCPH